MITPTAARRRYVAISALTWLPAGLGMPAFVLLMQVRGLDLSTIGAVFATYGIVTVAMELPTGGLADVLGRRAVLLASAAATTAAFVALAFATRPGQFLAVAVVKGVARALSSGPAEAWYVDAVHAGDPAADLRPGLARGSGAGSAALAGGTLAGGALPLVAPSVGPVVPLAVAPLCAALAAAALFAVVALTMVEPDRRASRSRPLAVVRSVPATVAAGVRLGLRSGALARLLLGSVSLGVALNAIELLTPGRLASLTGGAESGSATYAAVAALGFAASAAGAGLAGPVVRLLGGVPWRATAAGMTATAFALGGLAATASLGGKPGLVATATGYVALFLGLGVANPVRSQLLHARVAASERATLLSIDSLLLQLGGAASALGLGALAGSAGLGVAWAVAGSSLLLAAAAVIRIALPAPALRSVPEPARIA
jgi:hypothetical protein